MIARIWRGWTTPANADAFQHLMYDTTIPAFEARDIAGQMQIDLLRRDDGTEVEFTTIIQFDTMAAIERFTGDDPAASRVPAEVRSLLALQDARVTHHELVDHRVVPTTRAAAPRPAARRGEAGPSVARHPVIHREGCSSA